jgi:hypothetical protein
VIIKILPAAGPVALGQVLSPNLVNTLWLPMKTQPFLLVREASEAEWLAECAASGVLPPAPVAGERFYEVLTD